MATDVESLYAAVKAMVYVVKCNGQAQYEMERIRGYQTLAFLLKRHKVWLNNHILQLVLGLVGCDNKNGSEACLTPSNSLAFRDLLIDLDVSFLSLLPISTGTFVKMQRATLRLGLARYG